MLLLGGDVAGSTLGIIGAGRIGTAAAMRSAGFNMRVIYHDETRNDLLEDKLGAEKVTLDTLLTESDIISLHVPLLPDTKHLIDENTLKVMKPSAILINTSRGPVVDEKALAAALKNGVIAGAGLDVFENEPAVHPDLLDCENAVVLPHIGSATITARTKMAVMAAENLLAGLKGRKPPNLVNP
jgi:lactate dehydrogenase-like 2-hydroxyacid dehydrogenase